MANIHGINDAPPRNQGQAFNPNAGQVPNFLTAYFSRPQLDPRKESFIQMLKSTFCPTLTIKSFVYSIVVVDIVSFLITLLTSIIDPDRSLNARVFLGIDGKVVKYFDKYGACIADHFQIWRLITPVFLHVGFSHLLSNIISTLIFGSILEGMIGYLYMVSLYFTSGIGGCLFSAYWKPFDSSIGASTAINGVLTGILAMILVNWSAFNGNPQLEQTRFCLILFATIMIVLNLLSGAQSASPDGMTGTDTLGHVGGAISGFLFGVAFFPRVQTQNSKKWRLFGSVLFVSYFSLFFLLLLLGNKDGYQLACQNHNKSIIKIL